MKATNQINITHVSIKISQGGYNLHPISDFVNLPFSERMKLISDKKVTFLNQEGETIPLVEGVRYVCDLLRQKMGKTSTD